jgi:microcystin-dependent protein
LNIVPKGSIIAFNSDKAPEGWALCDGTNGTPDLRGRFIRMQSDSLGGFNEWGGKVLTGNLTAYDKTIGGNSRDDHNTLMLNHRFGDKAGTDHHTLHVNEMPVHSHGMNGAGSHGHSFRLKGASINGLNENNPGQVIGSWGKDQIADGYIGGVGDHTHTIQNAGGGWGHNNQPPYYVLSYIMKL